MISIIIVTLALIFFLVVYRKRRIHRQRRSQDVATMLPKIQQWQTQLQWPQIREISLPTFQQHLASLSGFLPQPTFEVLAAAAKQQMHIDKTRIPGHKKGNTVSFDYLRKHAPQLIAFYHSDSLSAILSRIIGETVIPTPDHDQSSCSLLIYTNPGDHIGWHYDYNFYKGRHFTVLLSLENCHLEQPDTLSSAQLFVKRQNDEILVPTPTNALIVFEGQKVIHKATKLAENERRILLSMTFCTNPSTYPLLDFTRRLKDIAFFGPRALWT